MESGDVGTIRGTLIAQRSADNWQAMPVQGEIHAHTDQLGLITLYVPDIDRAAGHLDADMKVAGTLGTPLIDGDLKISDGEIDYYQVNLGLRQLGFDAKLTDNGVDFKGSTRIGSGVANAKGRLEWRNSLPYGKVNVEGTNLRVTDVPEAQIDASPNLEFNINGRRIEVTGTVKVPYAKIVPADLSGAVRSSSDEVIVGEERTDPSKRFEVVEHDHFEPCRPRQHRHHRSHRKAGGQHHGAQRLRRRSQAPPASSTLSRANTRPTRANSTSSAAD